MLQAYFACGKELWTAIANARHFPWHDAALWLEDCAPAAPCLLAVGAEDTIINPRRITQVRNLQKIAEQRKSNLTLTLTLLFCTQDRLIAPHLMLCCCRRLVRSERGCEGYAF